MGMERSTMVDAADIERVTESLLVHKVQRRRAQVRCGRMMLF